MDSSVGETAAYATIIGPAWIGANTDIRPGAFIRGNVIVGEGCVLGNACEFKNCLLMDGVQVPHFSYVGDSILGNRRAFRRGRDLLESSARSAADRGANGDATYETGLRKFGAIVGDKAEVGCNAVLNPGTLLGPRALVTPPSRSAAICRPRRSRTRGRPIKLHPAAGLRTRKICIAGTVATKYPIGWLGPFSRGSAMIRRHFASRDRNRL